MVFVGFDCSPRGFGALMSVLRRPKGRAVLGSICTCFLVSVAQPAKAELRFDDSHRIVDASEPIVSARKARSGDRVGLSRGSARSATHRTAAKSSPRAKRTRLASLGGVIESSPAPARSLTGGGVRWVASAGCLASSLQSIIAQAATFGSVTVNSTCRSRARNRAVGGAGHSYHLSGNAADIRIRGNIRGAIAYLRSAAGGFKHYGGGLFHIDTGPRRSW